MIDREDWVFVFDLDDTLYLERQFVRSGFDAVGAHVQERFGISDFAARAARVFRHGDRSRVFDALVGHYGLDAGLIPSLVALYRDHDPQIALAPDVARWLQRHRHSHRIAVITDGTAGTQMNKLRALKLDNGDIAPIICTDRWGRDFWKPHPRSFEHVADHYRVPGRHCVYIADNPAKDFIAPRALGWRTIQIVRRGAIHAMRPLRPGWVGADAVIRSFDEIAIRLKACADGDFGARANG
jgi:putative hydrolase of the HAD superfamily